MNIQSLNLNVTPIHHVASAMWQAVFCLIVCRYAIMSKRPAVGLEGLKRV